MKRTLWLLTGILLICAAPMALAIDTIGAYSETNLGASLESATSLATTSNPGDAVTIHFFYTQPTDWSGEGAASGLSYYEFQINGSGFTSASYHDPATNLLATYDGTVLNVAFNPGTGAPLLPDGSNGGHIYLGYLSATVPTSGTTIDVSIRPYPASTEFTGAPNAIGPGVKNGSNDALALTCFTSSGVDPSAGSPDWSVPVFRVNGEAPVTTQAITWHQLKALYR